MSNAIDFAAARARILKLAAARNTYVDVEFSPAELAPTMARTVADLVRECVEVYGPRAVAQEIEQ